MKKNLRFKFFNYDSCLYVCCMSDSTLTRDSRLISACFHTTSTIILRLSTTLLPGCSSSVHYVTVPPEHQMLSKSLYILQWQNF